MPDEIMAASSQREYWAAQKSLSKVVAHLEDLRDKYYEWAQTSGNLNLWLNSHKASYAGMLSGGALQRTGENLEYTTIKINHWSNLKQHILTLVCGQRQYFESKSINTDHRSQSQTIIANSLCETVMREKDLEKQSQSATDYMVQTGEGYCLKLWDWEAGEDVAVESEEPVEGVEPAEPVVRKSGDVRFLALHPIDVVRDVIRNSHDDQDWYIVRTYENKWNLAAKYPKLKEQILRAPGIQESETKCPRIVSSKQYANWECDQIPVWLFFHKKCPAMPQGRMIAFVSKECALYDVPLMYREIPLYRMSAQDVAGIPLGYSNMLDLLAPQQALNATASTITTNLSAFGVQNIWVPEGARLTVEQAKGGLKLITGGQVKPEGLNLFSLPGEVIKFLELLERWLETLSGINSVARGNPEASLKSGSALALVQAQALQFLILWQKAYVKFLEKIASGTVYDFQDFGEVPHIITITGKANRQYVAEFTSANIDRISRVQIQVGNPLSGTIAGRVNMIEQMGNLGLISTPEDYFQVLQTGRLEPATEGTMAELLLIKQENEKLAEGQYVQAIILENHPLHLKEHYATLASPEVRGDPQIVENAMQHMQEHITLWAQANPMLLMALGIPPLDPSIMGGMQQQQGQAKGAVSQQDAKNQGVLPGPTGDAQGQISQGTSRMAKQPNMPKNPMTGQRPSPPSNGVPPY